MKQKNKKEDFLSMLLGTLGASLLGNLLTGTGIVRVGTGKGIVRAGTGNHSLNKKEWESFNEL